MQANPMFAALLVVLTSIVLVPVVPALAADCNVSGNPNCSCGDTVKNGDLGAIKTLDISSDPVVDPSQAACATAVGLAIDPGVTLEMGSNTIRGVRAPGQVGLQLAAGVGTKVLGGGRIKNFDQAIAGSAVVSGEFIRLILEDNRSDGIVLGTGSNLNLIASSTIRRNGRDCVSVTGNENIVRLNKVQFCGRTAVLTDGCRAQGRRRNSSSFAASTTTTPEIRG